MAGYDATPFDTPTDVTPRSVANRRVEGVTGPHQVRLVEHFAGPTTVADCMCGWSGPSTNEFNTANNRDDAESDAMRHLDAEAERRRRHNRRTMQTEPIRFEPIRFA